MSIPSLWMTDGKKRQTKFIDGYIAKTRVLIEQKGRGIDLTIGYRQSDESFLTPYQQARRYGGYLPQSEQPRWIIVSNFDEFDIHDMNRPNDSPEIVKLCDWRRNIIDCNSLLIRPANISRRKWRFPSKRASWLAFCMMHCWRNIKIRMTRKR